jgi:hypothetical protein
MVQTDGEIITLTEIAFQNPIMGGLAVYGARVLLRLDVNDDSNGYSLRQMNEAVATAVTEPYFQIFPNPVLNQLTLINKKGFEGSCVIDLYDMLARKVYSNTINNNQGVVLIDVSNFAKGIYTLSIKISNISSQKIKIIKN